MKRIYIETIKKWATGIGISGGTLVGLIFMYLFAIGAISNVSYSGDSICAGTESDPCYALINFTANEDIFIYPVGYDPWGRNTTFNFDPNVKSWKLQRSWGEGWRDIPLDKTCTGTWCGAPNNLGVKYSYVFREGKDYKLRIVAYKNYPTEDIKWGAFTGVDEIDPIWYGEELYKIEGNKVYTNDSKVYISATPHTLKSSGWVVFNFTSKVYSGNIDAVLGFDTSIHQPQKIERFNPTTEIRTREYTCQTDYFEYNSTYAWCYQNNSFISNSTGLLDSELVLLFEHEFDSGNLATKTISWNETYLDEWKETGLNFKSVDYDYAGMNKWYYTKNTNINKNKEYVFRVFIKNLQPSFNPEKKKYWFAIKPSIHSLSEAIGNSTLYALDPWTSGLKEGLFAHFNCSSNLNSINSYYNLNDTATRFYQTENSKEGFGGYCNFSTTDKMEVLNAGNATNPFNFRYVSEGTVCMWVRSSDVTDTDFILAKAGTWCMRSLSTQWQITTTFFATANYGGTTTPIPFEWQYFCAVRDSAYTRVYVNGSEEASQAIGTITYYAYPMMFGGNHDDSTFEGGIDSISFWNSSLTPDEISDLYNNGEGIPFDEVVPEDTCTASSPLTENYQYECSDNCTISSAVDANNKNITINGTGHMILTADIYDYDFLYLIGESSTSRCEIYCTGGCFI